MRTVIVRIAEPEQTGGALRGVVERLGEEPVPFSGADALLDLITAAATGTTGPAPEPEPNRDLDPH